MTTRIWIPIVTLALAATFACKDEQETVSPDDASADADADESEPEPEPAAPEADAPAVMTKASFDEAIHEHFDDVTNCYLEALSANAELAGTFSAEFIFDEDGTVTSVTAVEGSTLIDEGMINCVNEKAKAWMFDKPSEPGMTMRYDYELAPAE